jgi:hypothetical protein
VATAWEEVAVAATDAHGLNADHAGADSLRQKVGGVLLAAMALPGLMPHTAHAESAPEHGEVAYKGLSYQDAQPGLKRVGVKAHSVSVLAPLGASWSIEGSVVNDAVSGASPRAYTAISGASRMSDNRTAIDAKLTHYRERSAYGVSVSHSGEHDYVSNAIGANARFASEDNNTTWNVGLGLSSDKIDSSNQVAINKHKRSLEMLLGVTQAVTRADILQINATLSLGRGYFNDPYKTQDLRPDTRQQFAVLTRWNHHFEGLGATLRSSYRHYRDDWGIRSHTADAEWVQPVNERWTVAPQLRYYTQNSAKFYVDPLTDARGNLYAPQLPDGEPQSADQRLSAFGGLTYALKVTWKYDADWTADLKGERYEQRSSWRLGGSGSPDLDPFKATTLQLGLARRF